MDAKITWIKNLVALCIDENDTGKEKRINFSKLEEEFNQFAYAERDAIREIMMTQFEINDLIYVLSCIIKYTKLEEFKEDLLLKILEGNFNCYMGSMLELQVVATIKGKYKQKRRLHKSNIDSFDKLLSVNYTYNQVSERKRNRIVIITEQLLSILHAPTNVVLNFAYVLQEYLGYEVLIFVCPCDERLPVDLWYHPIRMASVDEFKNVQLRIKYRNTIFEGYQINMTQESPKEYSMMLSLIHEWNPLFVFDMGTCNPVADLTAKYTTLVAMEMSITCPISEGKILIRLDKEDEDSEKEYAEAIAENQVQLFMKEKMPVLIEKSQNVYSRTENGLPNDKFLIVIVGNRLDTEIDAEFVDVMKCILKKKENIGFVFIGEVQRAKEYFENEIFRNHVFYLGYREDLVGTYGMLDLYMNPKRGGGGFSSMMALAAGIPVVTLPNCDVAYNVGEEFVVQNYEEMIENVCRYIDDKEFYQEKKKCAQVNAERNSDEKMVDYVKTMIDGIIQIIDEQER